MANVGQKCSDGSIPLDLRSVIQSFGRMSKKDQAEYLELSNKYEKIPVPDSVKESYMTLRKEAVMRFVGSVNSKNSRPKKTREIKFKTQFHDFLKYFLFHKSQGRSGTNPEKN